jgi:hypothetical protein
MQPPPNNRSGPRLHVASNNPDSPTSRSNLKAIVITAAVTAVVGVAAVGIAQGTWGIAKRRALRLSRRQEEQQAAAAALQQSMQQPPMQY